MDEISIELFIIHWLPVHIKNKILFYLVESPLSKREQCFVQFFRFGNKTYNTRSNKNIEKFLPFRNEMFKRIIEIPYNTMYKIYIPKESRNDFIYFRKVMKTFVSDIDVMRIKNNKHMLIVKPGGTRKIIKSKFLDLENLIGIKYINETELANFPCGLLHNERETIMACYKPYNNGYTRKYALHTEMNYQPISISPLQMLWRIRRGIVSMREKKEMAKINQINGRSKLKTNDDYIKAFMKL